MIFLRGYVIIQLHFYPLCVYLKLYLFSILILIRTKLKHGLNENRHLTNQLHLKPDTQTRVIKQ